MMCMPGTRGGGVWVRSDLAPEEASFSQVKDYVDDLVEGGADAHVLLRVQPT